MDVDGDEEGTQRPRQVQDYRIEVDFEDLDDDDREVGVSLISISPELTLLQNGSPEAGVELDSKITKLQAELEKMAPNMKALEK